MTWLRLDLLQVNDIKVQYFYNLKIFNQPHCTAYYYYDINEKVKKTKILLYFLFIQKGKKWVENTKGYYYNNKKSSTSIILVFSFSKICITSLIQMSLIQIAFVIKISFFSIRQISWAVFFICFCINPSIHQ